MIMQVNYLCKTTRSDCFTCSRSPTQSVELLFESSDYFKTTITQRVRSIMGNLQQHHGNCRGVLEDIDRNSGLGFQRL